MRALRATNPRLSNLRRGQVVVRHGLFNKPARVVTFRAAAKAWEPTTDLIEDSDEQKIEELKQRFRVADVDGNGRIDKYELRGLLESTEGGSVYLTQHWYTQEEVDRIMAMYDVDESGDITFDEFCKLAYDGLLLEGTLEEYEAVFRAFDKSGNGTLAASELAEVLQELGQPLSYEKLVDVMQKYDVDASGQIDFNEFLLMFRDRLLDLNEALSYALRTPQSPTSSQILKRLEGDVTLIFSEEELDELARDYEEQLMIVFCGLTWCRPCKAMQRPYQKLADLYSGAVFVKLFGNANNNTKSLFKDRLRVRSTPCFLFFRRGQLLETVVGSNKEKLEAAIRRNMPASQLPNETLYPSAAPVTAQS